MGHSVKTTRLLRGSVGAGARFRHIPGNTETTPTAVLAVANELMYKVKRAGGREFEVVVYEIPRERLRPSDVRASSAEAAPPEGIEPSKA